MDVELWDYGSPRRMAHPFTRNSQFGAAGPGRRKLDRRIDWALSHPAETGSPHRRIKSWPQPLWPTNGVKNTDRMTLSLTPPSFLSRATRRRRPTILVTCNFRLESPK